MSARLKKHLPELQLLLKGAPAVRKQVLAHGSDDLIKCLSDCCYNILHNRNVPLSPKRKKTLYPLRRLVRQLASKHISLKKKRILLTKQKGRGIFTALIPAVVSLASMLFNR